MKFRASKAWLLSAASAALAFGAISNAAAQETNAEPGVTAAEDIVVLGRIQYRDRSDEIAPVLEYGTDYFQRFEPLTVGDALKRVPSAAFLSDVLESDGVRLRGLDPGYTQILINGEQVPGSGSGSGSFGNGSEGSFFVDRIPAELIERVEIVRSQSANRSGDAVAGALNIVLRDAYSLDGGYIRAGVLYFQNDDHWGEVLGGVWGGEVAGGRLLVGLNLQDRHNPKDKFSTRFDEPGDSIDNVEVQTDIRDGTDYSGNFSYQTDIGRSEFGLDGFYVRTERTENEDSIEYADGDIADVNIQTLNDNNVDITQESYSLNARYDFPMAGGETRLRAGYARFSNDEFEFEDEATFDEGDATEFPFPEIDVFESEITQINLNDDETRFKVEHEREISENVELEFGVHYERKQRNNLVQSADDDIESDVPGDFDPLPAPGQFVDRGDLEPIAGGYNSITRTRLDPYLMISAEAGPIAWEAGIRYETIDLDVVDRTAGESGGGQFEAVLPSAHVVWNLTGNDRILASAARTLRNPSFSFLSPALLEEELGDHDFRGDPTIAPETAWGIDVGYEHRIGRTGVVGVNYFYRNIQDLIEVFATSELGSNDLPILSARNTGDGEVWGVEFDLSAPLTIVGLENTGVFVNYSWLDSNVSDEFGERRFNDQAESVFNIGFIHDMPALGAAFGVTYRDQGDAFSRIITEEVRTSYGANLEMFVEKRLGERFSLRLTGSNLLDESKDEVFDKFDTFEDQVARDYDEFEIESETAGPVFQLIGRYAF